MEESMEMARLAVDYQLHVETGRPVQAVEAIKKELGETADQYRSRHTSLIQGDKGKDVPRVEHDVILAGLREIEQTWNPFGEQLRALLSEPLGSPAAMAAVGYIRAHNKGLMETLSKPIAAWQEISVGHVMSIRHLIYLAVLGTAIVSFVALWLAGRLISRPVRELARAARDVAAGNLGLELKLRSEDEVGQLRQAMNEMAASLRANRDAMRASAAQADEMVERIRRTSSALQQGRLDERVDTRGAEGKFRELAPA